MFYGYWQVISCNWNKTYTQVKWTCISKPGRYTSSRLCRSDWVGDDPSRVQCRYGRGLQGKMGFGVASHPPREEIINNFSKIVKFYLYYWKTNWFNLIFSITISPLKVPKLSNRGSSSISSPLAFAEGLFYFFELFYMKRRFLNKFVVLSYWNKFGIF